MFINQDTRKYYLNIKLSLTLQLKFNKVNMIVVKIKNSKLRLKFHY